jgi:hypothetical protein
MVARALDQWLPLLQPTARPRVVELQGMYRAPPVPPGYPVAPAVQRVETSEGLSPLSRSPTFGRCFAGEFPQTVDETVDIFSNDCFPGPPRPIAVHLYRSDQPANQVGTNCGLRAEITYSCGGIQNDFLCDWIQGGQFALVASSIRIVARAYAPLAGAYVAGVNDQVILGAMVGLESPSPQGVPVTFTTQQQLTVGAATGANFPVPDFGRNVVINAINDATTRPLSNADLANFMLVFAAPGGAVLKLLELNQDILREGAVIPGGTTLVTVLQIAAFANVRWSATFQLGL